MGYCISARFYALMHAQKIYIPMHSLDVKRMERDVLITCTSGAAHSEVALCVSNTHYPLLLRPDPDHSPRSVPPHKL